MSVMFPTRSPSGRSTGRTGSPRFASRGRTPSRGPEGRPVRERPEAFLTIHPRWEVREVARVTPRRQDAPRVPQLREEPLSRHARRVHVVRLDVPPPVPEVEDAPLALLRPPQNRYSPSAIR